MPGELRIEEPPGLKEAPLVAAGWCFPFALGGTRRGGEGLILRYKPRPGDPNPPGPNASATSAGPEGSTAPATPATSASGSPPPKPAAREDVTQRAPSDSYLELNFPFSKDANLRELYQRFFTDRMRFGLLLEDLDTLAGNIAARHAGVTDRVVLTASIDRISWLRDPAVGEVKIDHDLRMAGMVVWAGRSSMEVLIDITSREPASTRPDEWHFVGSARFVLVARKPDRTASASVPLLVPTTERERALFQQGKMHNVQRSKRRDSHWVNKPPTAEEISLVHDLIRNHNMLRTASHHHHHGSHLEPVPMQRTILQSNSIMQSQDRNIWNVTFGGHLLRLAYEHAFSTAALHAGKYCEPLSMDDVSFLQPVPIGTITRLTGQVVYVEGPVVRVHVRACKVEPGAPEQNVVTNMFSFAFVATSGSVRRVMPESMVEALEYVTGHRQHRRDDSCFAVLEPARSRL